MIRLKTLIIPLGLILMASGAQAHLQNTSFKEAGDRPANAAHWGVWGEKVERVTGWEPRLDDEAMVAYKHWELADEHRASSGIFQDAQNIRAGRMYELTVHAYADKPDAGTAAGRVEIRLESTIDDQQVYLNRRVINADDFLDEWKAFSIRARPPVDNLRAVIEFHPSASEKKGGALKIGRLQLSSNRL